LDLKGKWAWVHIDDLLIYSPTWEKHLNQMEETLKRLCKEGITLKISKCKLVKAQLEYLVPIVSNDGVAPIPSRVEQVANCAAPRNRKELRQFLGLAKYYRRFVKDYSVVVKPLTMLTSPNVEWTWSSAQQKAFDEVKQRLTSAPILAYPVNSKPFRLCTNISDYPIGAALEQEGEDGLWHVVAYGSRSLSGAEKNWSATEKECFEVVHFMNYWWHFLLGAKFKVLSDHQALSWMFGQAEPPTGKLAMWILKTQPFQPFNVKYWPGQVNNNSDTLSRQPIARLVAAIEPVKKTGNIEELREDPAFEWILKALNESGCQGKTSRQLALLDHMVINENGKLYHTHWPQGKTATKGILLQWVVPKSRREQLLALHHNTPVGGHLGHDKLFSRLLWDYWWPTLYKDVEQWVKLCKTARSTQIRMDLQQQGSYQSRQCKCSRRWEWTSLVRCPRASGVTSMHW